MTSYAKKRVRMPPAVRERADSPTSEPSWVSTSIMSAVSSSTCSARTGASLTTCESANTSASSAIDSTPSPTTVRWRSP